MDSYLTAEISAAAVRHNAATLRACLAPTCELCAVVKADAYGLGLETLAGVLGPLADRLAVAHPHEAIALRELGWAGPVLVFFSPCAGPDASARGDLPAELIRRDVTMTIVSPTELAAVAAAARHVGRPADVHVKIDTGMGRSGVLPDGAAALVEAIRGDSALRLSGLYTHFATADEADKTFAREQLGRFLETVEAIGGRDGLCLHAANSAATIDLGESHLDMVRPGIALYGYPPSDEMARSLPLRPALRLTGRLMQRKTLPAGSRCGYGLTYTFERDTPVGLVPVGYADGYPRDLSGRGTMRIRGRDVPVRGRISMDQAIVDLSDAPDAAVGDEVEILSNDPAAANSVENVARQTGTIPYEILCRLGARARRVRVDAGG